MAETGRPSLYTPEYGDKVCAGIARGKSLVHICKAKNMPSESTVYKWRREQDEFTQNYARAREDAADQFVQEIKDIADEADNENIQVAKLRCDVRKWTASRFNRAYQERQITEIDVNDSFADRILRARERGPDTEEA